MRLNNWGEEASLKMLARLFWFPIKGLTGALSPFLKGLAGFGAIIALFAIGWDGCIGLMG